MAARRTIQSTLIGSPFFVLWVVAIGFCIAGALSENEIAPRRRTVVASAYVTVSCMVIAWVLMSLPDRFPLTARLSVARLVWTLGWLALVIHIAIAFGVAHGWSHAAAVEHVRRVGGFGGGIVVNYLFAAVWLADVIWWWVNRSSYANRPRWMGWAVHGFLAFVVVNATLVFGSLRLGTSWG